MAKRIRALIEQEEMKDKIKGSYVFMKRPASRRRSREAYNEYLAFRKKLIELEPAGIVTSTSDERILTSGNYRVDYDNLPTVPAINLLKKQYDEINQSFRRFLLLHSPRRHYLNSIV